MSAYIFRRQNSYDSIKNTHSLTHVNNDRCFPVSLRKGVPVLLVPVSAQFPFILLFGVGTGRRDGEEDELKLIWFRGTFWSRVWRYYSSKVQTILSAFSWGFLSLPLSQPLVSLHYDHYIQHLPLLSDSSVDCDGVAYCEMCIILCVCVCRGEELCLELESPDFHHTAPAEKSAKAISSKMWLYLPHWDSEFEHLKWETSHGMELKIILVWDLGWKEGTGIRYKWRERTAHTDGEWARFGGSREELKVNSHRSPWTRPGCQYVGHVFQAPLQGGLMCGWRSRPSPCTTKRLTLSHRGRLCQSSLILVLWGKGQGKVWVFSRLVRRSIRETYLSYDGLLLISPPQNSFLFVLGTNLGVCCGNMCTHVCTHTVLVHWFPVSMTSLSTREMSMDPDLSNQTLFFPGHGDWFRNGL